MESISRIRVALLALALAATSCGLTTQEDPPTAIDDGGETAAVDSSPISTGSADDPTLRIADSGEIRQYGDRAANADDGSSTGSPATTSNQSRPAALVIKPTTKTTSQSTERAENDGGTTTSARPGSSTGRSSTSTTTRSTTSTRSTSTSTTTRSTTSTRPTTATGGTGGRFGTLPPGAALPIGSECAARVRPAREVRPMNAGYNSTRGTKPNGSYGRVDGNFVGTTDEIIQWAACKWGIDEDWARAQVAKESWWDMRSGGDRTSDQNACHPSLRTGSRTCPESIGLMQVRFLYHQEAFVDANAIRSSAYNVDYGFAVWRACYNGELTWLNDVDRGATYGAGDLEGCLGVWFSGRWYVDAALPYIAEVRRLKDSRVWEQSDFLGYKG